ncbi:MAG: hypothetical protein H6712_11510 [Myxococcales bacterium]|nr:hypothetical protein [Myxococcales bacterium]
MIPSRTLGLELALLALAPLAACSELEPRDLLEQDRSIDDEDVAMPHAVYFPLVTRKDPTWGTTSITFHDLGGTTNAYVFEALDAAGQVVWSSGVGTITAASGSSQPLHQVALPEGFRGSMVLRSSHPMAATAVQTDLSNRPMYNGSTFNDGERELYLPSAESGHAALVAIQNVTMRDVTVQGTTLAPGASLLLSGSAQVTRLEASGRIAAVTLEETTARYGTATEAVPARTRSVMAIAQCKDSWRTYSSYELHNPQGGWEQASIRYTNGREQAVWLAPGETKRVSSCDAGDRDFNGGAVISAGAPVAVTGSVHHMDLPGRTGFVGAASGAEIVALPYVRWWPDPSTTQQRTYIAVANTSTDRSIDVDVAYFDANGGLLDTHSLVIPPEGKANTFPCRDGECDCTGLLRFGTPDGNEAAPRCDDPSAPLAPRRWGGSARIISSDPQSVLVTARTATVTPAGAAFDAEDYNGVAVDAPDLPFMGVRGLPNGAHTLEYRVVSRCKPVTADEMVAAYTLEMDVELAGSSGHRTITIDAVRARDGWHAGDVDGTVLDSPIGHPLTITGHEPDGSTVVWDAGISQGWLLEQGKQWLPDVPALDLQRDLVLETTLVNGEENGAGNCAAIHLLGLRD